jgi:hypothetical protein
LGQYCLCESLALVALPLALQLNTLSLLVADLAASCLTILVAVAVAVRVDSVLVLTMRL